MPLDQRQHVERIGIRSSVRDYIRIKPLGLQILPILLMLEGMPQLIGGLAQRVHDASDFRLTKAARITGGKTKNCKEANEPILVQQTHRCTDDARVFS